MRLLSYVEDSLEPVTVAEAKLAARVDDDLGGGASSLDAEVQALITSAREQAEHLTGRIYRPQVRRAEWLDWPATGDANEALPVYLATVCAVSYWTGSTWATLSGSAYVSAAGGIGGNSTVLAPVLGADWPALGDVAAGPRVRVDLTAGPSSPDHVPECVKRYIKAQVRAWLDAGGGLIAANLQPNPFLERLLDSERLWA